MARTMGRLTALKVERAKEGMHCDGGGLYLQVVEGGASWVYRYMLNGRAREMGLGPRALVSLAEARQKAMDARRLCRISGVDPIEHRRAVRVQAQLDAAKVITFKQAADQFIASHEAGWSNTKHRDQWRNTLAQHVHPAIG